MGGWWCGAGIMSNSSGALTGVNMSDNGISRPCPSMLCPSQHKKCDHHKTENEDDQCKALDSEPETPPQHIAPMAEET